MLKLDSNQWNLVYNVFSFGLISMLAVLCALYIISRTFVKMKEANKNETVAGNGT